MAFGDLQDIHNLADLLLRLTHVLKLNIEVLKLLLKESKSRKELDEMGFEWRYKSLESAIDASVSQSTYINEHVKLVRSRADSIVAMVS